MSGSIGSLPPSDELFTHRIVETVATAPQSDPV
jgi:hypothetical protein